VAIVIGVARVAGSAGRPAWRDAATENDPTVLERSFVLDVRASFAQRAAWLAAPHPATLAADPTAPAWADHEPRPSLASHKSPRTASTPPSLIDLGQTSSSGHRPGRGVGNEHVRIGSGHSGGTDPRQQYRLNDLRPGPTHKPAQAAGNGLMETGRRHIARTLMGQLRIWVGRVAPTNYAAVN
jgi:hypothetical protein